MNHFEKQNKITLLENHKKPALKIKFTWCFLSQFGLFKNFKKLDMGYCCLTESHVKFFKSSHLDKLDNTVKVLRDHKNLHLKSKLLHNNQNNSKNNDIIFLIR